MTLPTICGLDPSLTASGIAAADGAVFLVKPGALRGPERLDRIEFDVLRAVSGADVVAVEGYAMHGSGSAVFGLGEVGGVLRLALWRAGIRYIDVPPAVLKTYATGKGNASKALVLVEAVKRLGYDGSDDNEADALWLRALLLDVYGSPVVRVPETHRRAFASLPRPVEPRA